MQIEEKTSDEIVLLIFVAPTIFGGLCDFCPSVFVGGTCLFSFVVLDSVAFSWLVCLMMEAK